MPFLVWMFPSPQDPYLEVLTPKVMVSGGGPFGTWLGCEDGGLTNGIRALIREVRDKCLSLLLYDDTRRTLQCETWSSLSPELDHVLGFHILDQILDFQTLELWAIHFCSLQTTQSMLFCWGSPNSKTWPDLLCPQHTSRKSVKYRKGEAPSYSTPFPRQLVQSLSFLELNPYSWRDQRW